MDGPNLRTDLDLMLQATSKCISLLPRQHRAKARRFMLKAFNMLSSDEIPDASLLDAIQTLADLFEHMEGPCIMETVVAPGLWGYTEWQKVVLIQDFQNFVLQPEDGLLTRVLNVLYEKAAAVLDDAEQAAKITNAVQMATEQGGLESFELVRGEDGIKPYRP